MNFQFSPKQLAAYKILTEQNGIRQLCWGGGAGGGKGNSADAVVYTQNGPKKWSGVCAGDRILHPFNGTQEVVFVHPWETLEKWVVHFDDGTHVDCNANHLWQAWRARKGRKMKGKSVFGFDSRKVIPTSGIKDWLDKGHQPLIPVCEPLQMTPTVDRHNEEIDPYLLGALIGDGCITKIPSLAAGQDDKHHWKDILPEDSTTYTTKNIIYFKGDYLKELTKKLERLKLLGTRSNDKFIPKRFKYGTIEERTALLQGLFDTDGHNCEGKSQIEYVTVSKQLSEDVAEVVRTMGGVCTISEKEAGYKDENGVYIECQLAYRLFIRFVDPDQFFRMERKKLGIKQKIGRMFKRITKIEIDGTHKERCITVSDPDGLYVTDNCTVTHNSVLGCMWVLFQAIKYPGSAWVVVRKGRKDLKQSTLKTFWKIVNGPMLEEPSDNLDDYIGAGMGWEKGVNYDFDAQDLTFTMKDFGSTIYFQEAAHLPADPMYNRLGSTEFTGVFAEEGQELHPQAITILMTRCRLTKGKNLDGTSWQTQPKMLISCNPMRNHIYNDYYNPWKKGYISKADIDDQGGVNIITGTKHPFRMFMPALATDNPWINDDYLDLLQSSDRVTKERLLHGNFEYDDNDANLFTYEEVQDLFTPRNKEDSTFYLAADVAGQGDDSSIFYVFNGGKLVDYEVLDKNDGKEFVDKFKGYQRKYNIHPKNSIYDADGMGAGFDGLLKGSVKFKAQLQPMKIDGELPYIKDLKAQVFQKLQQMVKDRELDLSIMEAEHRDRLQSELMVVERKNLDTDGKFEIISKADMKIKLKGGDRATGSPDMADALAYYCYFFLKKKSNIRMLNKFGKSLMLS